MSEGGQFRPISTRGGNDGEQLKRQIDQINLTIRDTYVVPAAGQDGEYVTQLAEPGGLHTCYPTSVLNGWIYQGVLTSEQAREIQNVFVKKFNTYFGPRKIHGETAYVWKTNLSELNKIAKEVRGEELPLDVIGVEQLDVPYIKKLILLLLHKGNVFVGGDNVHAVLVIGYDKGGEKLVIMDPHTPQTRTFVGMSQFAQGLKEGDPWLEIIGNDIEA